jgi:hypothetical protein
MPPAHISDTSHTPVEERHCVVDGARASAGHAALVPVHVSATSHTPADGRHTVKRALNALNGQ